MEEFPIFSVDQVDIHFGSSSEFVAAQAANNVLVLALQSNRLLRIDLGNPKEIDDVELPKKAQEVGIIRRLFLDPTASHMIINTSLNENFYLHAQSRAPKQLSRLKGNPISCVSWNVSQPTASTREILIGSSDGTITEAYIDPSPEFLRREERYCRVIHRADGPITGIWSDHSTGQHDYKQVLISTPGRLSYFSAHLGRSANESNTPVFAKLLETAIPEVHEIPGGASSRSSALSFTPEPPSNTTGSESKPDRIFAWLFSQGVFFGSLPHLVAGLDSNHGLFRDAQTLDNAKIVDEDTTGKPLRTTSSQAGLMALTQWHILQLFGTRLIATNRLDNSKVFDAIVLDPGEKPISLVTDQKMNTYWLFTTQHILEVRVEDEDRHIWKIMMQAERFEEALQYADTNAQKDTVATASGDFLMKKGRYEEAARVFGKSSKPFEEVALNLIDAEQRDALRAYLLTRLEQLSKSGHMQRVMIASWLLEVYMSKLNQLDDMVTTQADLVDDTSSADAQVKLDEVRQEFEDFIRRFKGDLDHKTSYSVMSSHGRERELLYFATAVGDTGHILSYWGQREQWDEALKALARHSDPELIYKYSSAFMTNTAERFVDLLMRQDGLDATRLIPALLAYDSSPGSSTSTRDQALRYLEYEINQHESKDPAVHNTLISILTSRSQQDERELLNYFDSYTHIAATTANPLQALPFDVDYALRLCNQHGRVRSCAMIYSILGQHEAAVKLALAHNEIEIAISLAEKPEHDVRTRKRLWLAIAKKVIQSSSTKSVNDESGKGPVEDFTKPTNVPASTETARISSALTLLQRAPPNVLRIEDLLPLFPDFVLIDAFQDEICSALEAYSLQIDGLKHEMEESAAAEARIKAELARLDRRWVLLEPGESCAICGQALVEKRAWLWTCGHGIHSDCAARELVKHGSKAVSRRAQEIKKSLEGGAEGKRREGLVEELDGLVGRECLLCGDFAVKMLDEPLASGADDAASWVL